MMEGQGEMGRVRCKRCGEVLESRHRHDFVQCSCPNETFVDGGNDYLRCGGMDLSLVEVLKDEAGNEVAEKG